MIEGLSQTAQRDRPLEMYPKVGVFTRLAVVSLAASGNPGAAHGTGYPVDG